MSECLSFIIGKTQLLTTEKQLSSTRMIESLFDTLDLNNAPENRTSTDDSDLPELVQARSRRSHGEKRSQ